jgi:alcohol dehydrogenase (NADP+)
MREVKNLACPSAARNIKADIELIRPKDINRAYERVMNKDVRYRFVIDMASLKA